ncbi:hypothetical protein RRG08_063946 [Elysia crispata]|uniref:Uncharacterized protein n=1 Tax=Elysia crispata TaxID=231223 RepID=A0AAE1CXF3_9GAST|nr:hypothetical protein RRG08_063946 [Elysia crispata]
MVFSREVLVGSGRYFQRKDKNRIHRPQDLDLARSRTRGGVQGRIAREGLVCGGGTHVVEIAYSQRGAKAAWCTWQGPELRGSRKGHGAATNKSYQFYVCACRAGHIARLLDCEGDEVMGGNVIIVC